MRYFLATTTQSKKDEGGYNEYGKMETKGAGEDAKINAIAELHETYATQLKNATVQYWCGAVKDMEQNVLDKLSVGTYVEAE